MFLKVGVISFSVALVFAAVVAVMVATRGDGAEKTVAAEPVASAPVAVSASAEEPEPTIRSRPAKKEKPPPPEASPKAALDTSPKPEPKVTPKAPVPAEPEPEATPEAPAPAEPLPVARDWPAPKDEEVAEAEGPRRYKLPPEAVMGLTIKDMNLYNAPVFDSNSQEALDSGVVHVPETSFPWSRGEQRNVYLAGHRLGYAGTGSRLIFYNLDALVRGDEVMLKDRDGKAYRYRVIETFVADPEDSWVMGEVRDRDLLTLQTCTGPGYSERLIVRAERV